MLTLRSLILMILLTAVLTVSTQTMATAKLAISPVQINLFPSAKTASITLINKGDKSINLYLRAKSWDMDENGKFIETDTGEFVFYPKTLTIDAKEQATIRVGYTGEFPDLEQPFRIIIQEIPQITQPDPEQNQTTFGVSVALRLSIPLYVVPVTIVPPVQVEIGDLKISDNSLRVGVKNLTDYHVNLKKVAITLFKQNQVLAENTTNLQLQRVLGQRLVFIKIPMNVQKLCAQADAIEIQVSAENLTESYQTRMSLKQGCQL